jgi:hypothetical protein
MILSFEVKKARRKEFYRINAIVQFNEEEQGIYKSMNTKERKRFVPVLEFDGIEGIAKSIFFHFTYGYEKPTGSTIKDLYKGISLEAHQDDITAFEMSMVDSYTYMIKTFFGTSIEILPF